MKNPPHKPQEEEWEDPYPKKKKTHWFTALVLAIVLYLLSYGPATMLMQKQVISQKIWLTAYFPILALSEQSKPVEDMLNWYTKLWGKK